MPKSSLILLSSGLDSAANLALATLEFSQLVDKNPKLALTFNYGQRASAQEIKNAGLLCKHFGVEHKVIDIGWLGVMGGSALTEKDLVMPDIAIDDNEQSIESAKKVWVPNRNGVFINIAASFAERLKIETIYVGFNKEEAETFSDNSQAYLDRVNRALSLSCAAPVKVASFTVGWNKTEIVKQLKLNCPQFPFQYLWSCYEGGDLPCGVCESCKRLKRALGE